MLRKRKCQWIMKIQEKKPRHKTRKKAENQIGHWKLGKGCNVANKEVKANCTNWCAKTSVYRVPKKIKTYSAKFFSSDRKLSENSKRASVIYPIRNHTQKITSTKYHNKLTSTPYISPTIKFLIITRTRGCEKQV